MKASVLINNFNYGRYLRRCIESACAQTYKDVEVVVVDDGSTDGSIDIIKSFGDKVKAVFKNNGGQASCFNAGFERSSGDIVFFLDADDEFHHEKIAIIMKIYKLYKAHGVQWCFDFVDESRVPELVRPVAETDISMWDFRASITKGIFPIAYDYPVATSSLSFERSLLDRILPMPTSRGVTLSDNYLKFASAGLSVGAICHVPLSYQRIHDSNRYTRSSQNRIRRTEIMMETGGQLARQFPFLSRIGVKLVSTAIAERIAQRLSNFPLLFKHWRGSPFALGEKLRITGMSAIKTASILLARAPERTDSSGA